MRMNIKNGKTGRKLEEWEADLLPDSCYRRENIVVAPKRHVADQHVSLRGSQLGVPSSWS